MQPGNAKTLIHCISNESGTSNIFILWHLLMSKEEWLSIGNTDTLKTTLQILYNQNGNILHGHKKVKDCLYK